MFYKGREVFTPEDIDKVTAEDIRTITGGVSEELGMHRKAIKALWVLSHKELASPQALADAESTAHKLSTVDNMIERVVEGGKSAKRELKL